MTASAAEQFVRAAAERLRLRRELDEADAALVAWREHDADRALPLEWRRYPSVPEEPLEALRRRQAALAAELARLDGGFTDPTDGPTRRASAV